METYLLTFAIFPRSGRALRQQNYCLYRDGGCTEVYSNLKVHSVSATKVPISWFWNAGLVLIFPTVRAANKFQVFLRTLLGIQHSPEQVGTAGPGQHMTLGQRKLPSENLHTSGKWFSKQLFHKALRKTLFQSHYLALEGFLLEEGALDTCGCQLKKHRDELWQSLATSPAPLPPSCKKVAPITLLTDSSSLNSDH